MAEWLKAHAWKACLGETLTWVRIPLSPPDFQSPGEYASRFAIPLAGQSASKCKPSVRACAAAAGSLQSRLGARICGSPSNPRTSIFVKRP